MSDDFVEVAEDDGDALFKLAAIQKVNQLKKEKM